MPYLQTTWTTEPPASPSMSWGNVVFLATGAAPSQASNPQLITTTNYVDYLTAGTEEYKAIGSYKNNIPGSPTNSTYVYWMGDNVGMTGILQKVTYIQYLLNLGPFASIDSVWVDPTGGSNWTQLIASDITFCIASIVAASPSIVVIIPSIFSKNCSNSKVLNLCNFCNPFQKRELTSKIDRNNDWS